MAEDRNYIRKRRVSRRAFHRQIGVLARGNYYITYAYEIGEGGMLFASKQKLSVNQKVVLSFNVPGFVHVVCRAVIRYSKKLEGVHDPVYGVQFETIEFNSKRKVRSYVAQKSAEEIEAAA